MIFWSDIKDKLKNHTELAIQLLLLILGAYIFIMAEKHSLRKTPLLFLGLLSWFFFRTKTKHPIIWLVLFALLVFDLFYLYFRVANHHFLLTFVVLSVIFYLYHKRTDVLQKNIQVLLVVVVMASVIQKLMSNQFMSGDFYYYMMNRAYIFDGFHTFFPEILEVAKTNSESILNLQDTDPNRAQSIVLKDIFPNLGFICLIYAWSTVVLEFIVAIAILCKPRSTWTHLLFIAMILGILCTRLEVGFMALLGICGIFLCCNEKLRLLYVLIVIGCITLVVTKLGYH
jgi:hypothetical protein